MASVAAGFTPGAHRRTVVARGDGVTWVDDSKATNPHAAVAAAGAYPSVILIAGGRNKGLDLSPLTTVPSVRRIVAIGEAAPELAAAGGDRVDIAADLADAVRIAGSLAEPGDTVLLAPGCASFDMFTSYADRGDAFAAEVAHVTGNPGTGNPVKGNQALTVATESGGDDAGS
jgi:UDP-N-acetylmuramoylalanine--D-glutamate ligase